MIFWLIAIGLVSILGQVVLLRELNVAFYGSELIYVLALGVWLFGTGVGAALGRRASRPGAEGVRLLLLAHGWALPAAVVLIRELRRLLGAVPGAYLSLPRQLIGIALVLLPVCLLLGLLFQWAAKLYVREGRTLAGAYAVESAGGLAGGVMATLFLVWGIQNLGAALIGALLSVAVACHPWRPSRPRWLLPLVVLTALPLAGALVWSNRLDHALTARNHPHLLATRDSPYGRVTLTRSGEQLSVFENDALAFESEGTAAEEFAHLAAVQHPRPESVLILGGGLEGLVRELLHHRPRLLHYVELNRILFDLLTPHLPADVAASLDAAPVEVHVADPRRFLERAGRYDLILVGMPEPDSGQTNRFYTREFFALCSEHLEPGGVLAFRLRGAENLWTPLQTRRAASIHHALRSVFADAVVLPGGTNIIVASDRPLSRDPAPLALRLERRAIPARMVIPAYVNYLYRNDRFGEIEGLLASSDAPPNLDARPICYQYTQLLWLARFLPGAGTLDLDRFAPGRVARSPATWALLAVAIVVLLLARRKPIARRALLAALAGFAGMLLESVLILDYQTRRGVLYQDLGLLLTMFMAGLMLGAAGVDRWARHSGGRALERSGTGLALVAALAALGLALGLLTGAGGGGWGLGLTGLLLLAAGLLVAALFAYAALVRSPDQQEVVSPLYASDLLGGSLGSLAASLFLVPVLGLAGTAFVTAALVLLGLLLV